MRHRATPSTAPTADAAGGVRHTLTDSALRGLGTGVGFVAALTGLRALRSAGVRAMDAIADRWQRYREGQR